MKWYIVHGVVTVSAYRYVQAGSREEAKRLAADCDVELCPQGPSRHGMNPIEVAVIGEGDGTFVPERADLETPDAEFLEELEEPDGDES